MCRFTRPGLCPRHVVLAAGALQSARLAFSSGLDARSPLVGRYVNDHLFVQSTAELAAGGITGTMNVIVDPAPDRKFQLTVQGPFEGTWYHQSNSTMWINSQAEGTHLMLAAFGVGSVRKDNRVVLSDEGDPRYGGIQNFRARYERSEDDEKRLAAMRDALERTAVALGAEPGKSQVNPPGGALHEIGGLRMRADAETGVTGTHSPWPPGRRR